MLLRIKNPRTLFILAVACLAGFGVLGMVQLRAPFNEELFDGMRGALLGATIALIYLTSRLDRRRKGR